MKFIYKIIRRTFQHGPKMLEFVKENNSKVIILHSYKEIDNYFAKIKKVSTELI
jgi:hypothetical protein